MKRGDIVTVALPGAIGKPRPALVIQSDLFDQHRSATILPVSGWSDTTGTGSDAPRVHTIIFWWPRPCPWERAPRPFLRLPAKPRA